MLEKLKNYQSSLILLFALLCGGVLGIYAPDFAIKLKPIGQIFLNLLFMIIVPLVGIGVTASISRMTDLKRLGKVMSWILLLSFLMALIPTLQMLGMALLFNPAEGVSWEFKETSHSVGTFNVVSMFTTEDFSGLLNKANILPLIIFSILAGIGIGQSGEKGQRISALLSDADEVIMNIVNIIMKAAPLGLGCYFASTMASQDPALIATFGRATVLFLVGSLLYYLIASSVYAYIGDGKKGVKVFWQNALSPSVTALATCSSLGSLPANVRAAHKMGLNAEIADISLPLLANLNKGGTSMGTALKIIFLYALLGLPITPEVIVMTIIISILSAVVTGGVPGGAFLGEIFIITTLNFPMETLPILVILGTLDDAPATVLNVINDLNATQIIQRFCSRKV